MADAIESVGKIIPTLYYDLIARVIPGAATLAVYIHLGGTSMHAIEAEAHLDGALFGLLLFTGAYVLGMMITPVGSICGWIAAVIARLITRSERYKEAVIWKKVDEVGSKDEAVAAMLGKMAAEVTLCQNLFGGLLLATTISGCSVDWPRTMLAMLLVFLALAQRTVFFVERLERLSKT